MKGTLFQKPVEFNLEVLGEAWTQGSQLNGSLKITNHGHENVSLENLGVALALGHIKKVKTKNSEAFKISETQGFPTSNIAPGEKTELNFDFKLNANGPITDKTQSPYLIYGDLEKKEGHLQLTIEPSLTFKPLLDVLDIFFRFKLKERKFAKNVIEFKFIAPDAKEFKSLEHIVVKMKELEAGDIDLDIQFNMKKVGVSDGTVALTKAKESKKMALKFKDYMFQKDAPNQEAIRKIFQGLFDEVLPKQLF